MFDVFKFKLFLKKNAPYYCERRWLPDLGEYRIFVLINLKALANKGLHYLFGFDTLII